MKRSTELSRRRFLARTAGTAAFLAAAPTFVPARAFGANDRVLTGHIGLGGQGRGNLRALSDHAIALCDVDSRHLQAAAKEAQDRGRECELFSDYRMLLERDDIDAVVVSTPDHWHALPVIHACEAGKDVYCEKPLSLTIAEGRAMVEAARKNNRIVQTGSQQRSAGNFRRACELVRNGYLGAIKEVHVGIAASNHPFRNREPIADSDPPAELNYDMWLGQAPWRPYNELHVHYNFRFFWDYSGGQMTNWGAHHIDIAHWGLGMDESGPLAIEGQAEFNAQGWHDVSETCRITYRYPNDVTLIVGQQQRDIGMGTKFIGEKGTLHVDRGKLSADPAEILETELAEDDVRLYESGNHHGNFIDCVKSRELPICDVEIGHRTATACHLGNIAIRLGRAIRWNAADEKIEGDDEAAAMCSRPMRAPWTLEG
ncbi:MAG: Gfo/Idh/MocA family oxidoreductase [Planctomycetales bacterium]|nr:Gfo/Idh/MocA family oxidoreductase [Planctomycetales bacterium]